MLLFWGDGELYWIDLGKGSGFEESLNFTTETTNFFPQLK